MCCVHSGKEYKEQAPGYMAQTNFELKDLVFKDNMSEKMFKQKKAPDER